MVDTFPSGGCIVSPDTVIACEGPAVEREGTMAERVAAAAQLMSEGRLLRKEIAETKANDPNNRGLGGMEAQMDQVDENVTALLEKRDQDGCQIQ